MIYKYITIVLLVILLIFLFNNANNNAEHLTTITATSNEALQNLSSAYNTGTATLSNLAITGALTNTGATTLSNLAVTGALTIGNTVIDQSGISVGSVLISPKSIPGAYIINEEKSTYPVCSSLSDYNVSLGIKNFGNYYIVLPGYKIIAYKYANYSAGSDLKSFETYDNTTGTIQKIFTCGNTIKNNDVSCKLYYKDILL